MSDIVINNDHCALILNKEEAMLIYALVGRLPCSSVGGAGNIFNTIRYSEFITRDEYRAWWDNHAIKVRKDLKCSGGDTISIDDIILMAFP